MNLPCQLTEQHLYRFRNNNLSDQERQETHLHVASCPACQATLRRLESLLPNIQQWPEPATDSSETQVVIPAPPVAQKTVVRPMPRQDRPVMPPPPLPNLTLVPIINVLTIAASAATRPERPAAESPQPATPAPQRSKLEPVKAHPVSLHAHDIAPHRLNSRPQLSGLRFLVFSGFGLMMIGMGFITGRYTQFPGNLLAIIQPRLHSLKEKPDNTVDVSELPAPRDQLSKEAGPSSLNAREGGTPAPAPAPPVATVPSPAPAEPKPQNSLFDALRSKMLPVNRPALAPTPAPTSQAPAAASDSAISISRTPEGWTANVAQDAKSLENLMASVQGGFEAPRNFDFTEHNLLVLTPQTRELATPVLESEGSLKLNYSVKVPYSQRSRRVTDGPPMALFISLPKSPFPVVFSREQ